MQKPEKIANPKRRGEWAELCFMSCAEQHGMHVSRPYGDSAPFDFIVGDHGCLLRIQVKSTLCRRESGYACCVWGARHRRYEPDDFDFLVVLIVPENVWYIIPETLVQGKGKIFLYPKSSNSKYAPYKDAWHLLSTRRCFLRGTIDRIEAYTDLIPSAGCAPCAGCVP